MMNNLKAFAFILTMPVALVVCFKQDQIKKPVSRQPAIEKMIKTDLKSNIARYLIGLNK